MTHQKPPKKPLNQYAKYSAILFQMIAIIAIGTYIGIKLDENYPNKHDSYTIIGATLSVIISIYVVIKQVIKFSEDE
jgi:F0F1-type ATP synthase assembly protein I